MCSSAFDKERKMKVAIKKLGRPLQTTLHAKRAYREIRMLKHMHHDNVRFHYSRYPFTHFTVVQSTFVGLEVLRANVSTVASGLWFYSSYCW